MAEILLNISIVTILISLVKMLIPSNAYQKQMNFLIVCVFLVSIFFFVTKGDYNIDAVLNTDKQLTSYVDFADEYEQSQRAAVVDKIVERTRAALERQEIQAEEIRVIINILDDGGISINKIKLVLADEADAAKAINAVEKEVGVKAVVENNINLD